MDGMKRCLKCDNEKELSDFNIRKDTLKYRNQCRDCFKLIKKEYQNINKDKINLYNKSYFQHIKKRINESRKNRRKTDVSFRLICNTGRIIHHALNGKLKSISTEGILGIDLDTYRKWLEFQFTPEMNWEKIEIDQVKPICMFDVSKDGELREAFNLKIHSPYSNTIINRKVLNLISISIYINFNLCKHINSLGQLKKNITKIFISEVYSKPPKKNFPTNKTTNQFYR